MLNTVGSCNRTTGARRCESARRASPLVAMLCLVAAAGLAATLPGCSGERDTPGKVDELAARLEKLRSVPYTTDVPGEVYPDSLGVIRHDPERACRGYNLVCQRIGQGAYLMDMEGRVVHRWAYPEESDSRWIRVEILDNGDIIALHNMHSVLRLDWNSNLIWKKRLLAHHDIAVAPDSSVYALVFGAKRYRGYRVRFTSSVHLSADGQRIGKWSTYDHLEDLRQALDQRSFLDTVLDSLVALGVTPDSLELAPGALDYFHANTLTIIQENELGRKDGRFAAGRLLTCFRNVNQIAVMDLDTMEILWAWGEGILEWPHHPTMLENGHILVFDNGVFREYTRVVEMDPATGNIVWEYDGRPDHRFYSPTKGSSQRLMNGNTLICDANNGRAVEVTGEGEIVWEWFNSEIEEGHRAQLYRFMRHSPEKIEPLLRHLGSNKGEVAARP